MILLFFQEGGSSLGQPCWQVDTGDDTVEASNCLPVVNININGDNGMDFVAMVWMQVGDDGGSFDQNLTFGTLWVDGYN